MCHLQVGREKKVAVVLACPGQAEELIGMPAAGPTGQNLKILLELLSRQLGRSDLIRQNITITNSSVKVMHKKKDKETEPKKSEIMDAKNICRVYEELREVSDFVIFSGESAKIIMENIALPKNPKLIHIRHLGLQSLNQIHLEGAEPQDGNDLPEMVGNRTFRRLEKVATEISGQLAAWNCKNLQISRSMVADF